MDMTNASTLGLAVPPPLQHVFKVAHPNAQVAVVIALVHLFGVSLIATFLARRLKFEDFRSLQALRQISPTRLYLTLTFLISWIYLVIAGVLVLSIGLDMGRGACNTGILICITLYSGSKLFVYLFLGERVHTVWCPTFTTPRYKSPLYLLSLVLVLAYFAVVCHLYIVRIATTRIYGICLVGLELNGVILLLVFDVVISVVMTSLFVWPLLRHSFRHSQLRHIARRSVTAASIALTTSCANISALAAMGGVEYGWLLLLCWEADVLISDIAFFWLTSGSGLRPVASMVEEIRARDNETFAQSPKCQRRGGRGDWLQRTLTNSSLSSFIQKRPDFARQASLPTIMTHGHGVFGEGELASVSSFSSIAVNDVLCPGQPPPLSPLPKAALPASPGGGDAPWPALAAMQRPRANRAWPSDLSTIVVLAEKDVDVDEESIRSCARTIAEGKEEAGSYF